MSSYEYYDLFYKSQNTGKYHMFIFDIVGSQKMNIKKRQEAEEKMIKLMYKIYNHIKKIELNTNTKILITDSKDIIPLKELTHKHINKFGMLYEPFFFADTFGFTTYKGTITKEEILNMYIKYKNELNIDFDFHIQDGFYETNDWNEGQTSFFRGYCIDILSTYHKEKNKILKKKYNLHK